MVEDKKDFFISYTSVDEKWATWVAGVLENEGYSTVIQAWDFKPGTNFIQNMQKATINCKRTIAILSKEYLNSIYTQSEWQAAFAQDPTSEKAILIPIKISKDEPIGLLKQIIYIDLFEIDEEESTKRLLKGIDISNRHRMASDFPGTLKKKLISGELPLSNIKLLRNINFSGRTNVLNDIHKSFNENRENHLYQILVGTGGVGKSQIALEYAYKFGFEYDVVWWIDAEKTNVILEAYRQFALVKGIIDENRKDTNAIVNTMQNWTKQNKRWLFVYDNVENVDIIYNYLPINPQGHVLITSRNTDWGSIGISVDVDVFSADEAVGFMRKRTQLKDEDSLVYLIEKMGKLPLALEQAAAYIVNASQTYKEYIELFNEYKLELLDKYPPRKYNYTVATTWNISIHKICDESSIQLLDLIAFLYSDGIDTQFFNIIADYLPEPLSSKLRNKIESNDIFYNLKEYSLIKYNANTISIHRLLQEVIQASSNVEFWISTLINSIYSCLDFDSEDKKSWECYNAMFEHICSIANHGYRYKVELLKTSYLYHQIGCFYNFILTDYEQAEIMYNRALEIREKLLGSEDEKTLITFNNLAGLYNDQGRYNDAEELYLSTISVCEKTMGKKCKLITTIKNNLAQMYCEVGRLEEAKKIYLEVFQMRKTVLGKEDNETATTMVNLALLLLKLGELEKAEKLLKEGLKIKKRKFGLRHQSVANILDHLAKVYHKQGKYKLAEQFYTESLNIREDIFNKKHPERVISMNNVAGIYIEQGRLQEAEGLLKEALALTEEINQISPCEIASCYNNLGYLYWKEGMLDEAEPLLEKALELRKELLGENNIDYAMTATNLAQVFTSQGRYNLAKPLYKQAFDVRKEHLGMLHQDTIAAINNLGLLYYNQKEYSKAEPMLEQALELSKQTLGDKHRDTIESYYTLAVFYLQNHKTQEGMDLLLRAIELSEKVLGNSHETTIMIRNYFQNVILPHAKIV